MAIKNTPEHPVVVSLIASSPAGDLNNLLGVVVLDWVVAWELCEIVSRNTVATVHRVGLLQLAQLVRRLFRGEHLDNLVSVARGFRNGTLADNGSLPQLVGANDQDGAGGQGIRLGGRGQTSRERLATDKVGISVGIPSSVPDDDAGQQGDRQAAEIHGGLQRHTTGGEGTLVDFGRGEEAPTRRAGEASDGGEGCRPAKGSYGGSIHG